MRRSVQVAIGFIVLYSSAGAAFGQTRAVSALETTKVVSRLLDKTISIPGDLTAYQAVDVRAKVAAFVDEMRVDRGSSVRQGQMLGVLSAPELHAQRLEAEAKLQSVRANQLEAEAKTVAVQSTFDRFTAAAATPGVVAGHDIEIAERNLEAVRAQVSALKSSVAAAEAAVKAFLDLEAYLELRAPFDGVITERYVHQGSFVSPAGSPMVRIEQISRLRLVVPVPETYVGGITKGTRVNFRVLAFPDQTFQGIIARPANTLDMKTRSMLVELDVNNPTQMLAPGMYADVQWPVSRSQASIFVPSSAIVRTSERQFVVRVRNGVTEWVDVRRGELSGDLVEVFGGLRDADVIVRRGTDEIRPGTRITQNGANR